MRNPEKLTRRDRLPDDPSYSSIRAAMTRLVAKGELNYSEQGPRYVYSPAVQLVKARRFALKKLVDTFFGGSSLKTMTALLDDASKQLSREEFEELQKQVTEAKRRRAKSP